MELFKKMLAIVVTTAIALSGASDVSAMKRASDGDLEGSPVTKKQRKLSPLSPEDVSTLRSLLKSANERRGYANRGNKLVVTNKDANPTVDPLIQEERKETVNQDALLEIRRAELLTENTQDIIEIDSPAVTLDALHANILQLAKEIFDLINNNGLEEKTEDEFSNMFKSKVQRLNELLALEKAVLAEILENEDITFTPSMKVISDLLASELQNLANAIQALAEDNSTADQVRCDKILILKKKIALLKELHVILTGQTNKAVDDQNDPGFLSSATEFIGQKATGLKNLVIENPGSAILLGANVVTMGHFAILQGAYEIGTRYIVPKIVKDCNGCQNLDELGLKELPVVEIVEPAEKLERSIDFVGLPGTSCVIQ